MNIITTLNGNSRFALTRAAILGLIVLTLVSLFPFKPILAASSYVYAITLGSAGGGAGQLSAPLNIAIDSMRNVTYVADAGNNRIEKLFLNGSYSGQWVYTGAKGIAVDPVRNVVYAIRNDDYLFKFDSNGTQLGYTHTNIGTANGVAVDNAGNVYVADPTNHYVVKFDSSLTYLTAFGAASLTAPSGVAVDRYNHTFVSDTATNKIAEFDNAGGFVKQFGSTGHSDGQLFNPTGVAVDPFGFVYVADYGNNRIDKFNATTGTFVSSFGSHTYGSLDGMFSNPSDLSFDANGTAYVLDLNNERLEKFVPNVAVNIVSASTTAPKWGITPVSISGIAVSSSLGDTVTVTWGDGSSSTGIAISSSGSGPPLLTHTLQVMRGRCQLLQRSLILRRR